jgi:hypothetical protein
VARGAHRIVEAANRINHAGTISRLGFCANPP